MTAPENIDPAAPEKPRVLPGFFGTVSDRLSSGLNAVGTLWIFALMLMINADIGGRSLFNLPLRGVPELVSLSIVGIVFLQMSHSLRSGRIIRSDALLGGLTKRLPRLGHGLNALFHAIGAVLFGILLWASFPLLTKAWEQDLFVGSEGDFTVPIWPIKLIILIGCFAMAFQFLMIAAGHARRMLGRADVANGDAS